MADEKMSIVPSLVSGVDYLRPHPSQDEDPKPAAGAGGPPAAKKQKIANAIKEDLSSDDDEVDVQYKRYVDEPGVNHAIFEAEMVLYQEYGYDEDLEELLKAYTERVLKALMPRMR